MKCSIEAGPIEIQTSERKLSASTKAGLLHPFPSGDIERNGFNFLTKPVDIGHDGFPEGVDHWVCVADYHPLDEVEREKLQRDAGASRIRFREQSRLEIILGEKGREIRD